MASDAENAVPHYPSESAHDYVVIRMVPGADLRCLYTVECSRCDAKQSGYADEIPPARFGKVSSA